MGCYLGLGQDFPFLFAVKMSGVKLDTVEVDHLRSQRDLDDRRLKIKALNRDVKISRRNLKIYAKHWDDMASKAKLPYFKSDILFAWHNFEYLVDAKDFQISMLLDQLQEDEDHTIMVNKGQCECIDKLLDKFNEAFQDTQLKFNTSLKRMLRTFKTEFRRKEKMSQAELNDLKLIVFMDKKITEETKTTSKGRSLAKAGLMMETDHQSRIRLLADAYDYCTHLYENINSMIDDYNDRTRVTRRKSKKLYEQEDTMHIVLKQQTGKIEEMLKTIGELNQKYNMLKRRKSVLMENREEEFSWLTTIYEMLRKKLVKNTKDYEHQLLYLVTKSKATIDELTRIRDIGKQILSLAALCRRHETAKEKVLPFPYMRYSRSMTNIFANEEEEQLETFWRRVANADRKRYDLIKEYQHLKSENARLEEEIGKFCECLDCPDKGGKINVVKLTLKDRDKINKSINHENK